MILQSVMSKPELIGELRCLLSPIINELLHSTDSGEDKAPARLYQRAMKNMLKSSDG